MGYKEVRTRRVMGAVEARFGKLSDNYWHREQVNKERSNVPPFLPLVQPYGAWNEGGYSYETLYEAFNDHCLDEYSLDLLCSDTSFEVFDEFIADEGKLIMDHPECPLGVIGAYFDRIREHQGLYAAMYCLKGEAISDERLSTYIKSDKFTEVDMEAEIALRNGDGSLAKEFFDRNLVSEGWLHGWIDPICKSDDPAVFDCLLNHKGCDSVVLGKAVSCLSSNGWGDALNRDGESLDRAVKIIRHHAVTPEMIASMLTIEGLATNTTILSTIANDSPGATEDQQEAAKEALAVIEQG